MEINWLVLSVIGNIVFGLYGAGLTTYTIIKSNKEKRRQLAVKISWGGFPPGYELSGKIMLFITVANPGNRRVTINSPQLELPDGSNIFFPLPTGDVRFPHELEEGKDCTVWTELESLKHELIKKGYSGKVKLRGKVKDRTGKEYRAKKAWTFDLKET